MKLKNFYEIRPSIFLLLLRWTTIVIARTLRIGIREQKNEKKETITNFQKFYFYFFSSAIKTKMKFYPRRIQILNRYAVNLIFFASRVGRGYYFELASSLAAI